jgi:hypothetical protein
LTIEINFGGRNSLLRNLEGAALLALVTFACSSRRMTPTTSGGASGTRAVGADCGDGNALHRCLPGVLRGAPVIAGPGRLRVLVENPGQTPASPTVQPGFTIYEIYEGEPSRFAEGVCPTDASEPQSLTLLVSGRTGVICAQSDDLVSWGEISSAGGRVEWRWRERLHHPPGNSPGEVPYIAQIGSKAVIVFELRSPKGGVKSPPYAVQIIPGPAEYRPLCVADHCAERIVTFLVVGGVLHIIWTNDSETTRGDFVVTQDGDLRLGDPVPLMEIGGKVFDPRDRASPCVSKGRDGAVNIDFPGLGTARYEGADLPQGPDVYPAESARCPPRHFGDPAALALPDRLRESLRATQGSSWVIAYGAPPPGGRTEATARPGVRIVTWSGSPSRP